MFETPLTVVGTIVNDLQRRTVGEQAMIRFRVASNSRRRGTDGTWEPGNSLFITVNCWGRLVTGVGATLGKGSPVIVVGHIYTSEYEDRDGVRRSSLEMRATAVGTDLARADIRNGKSTRSSGNGEPPQQGTESTDKAEPGTDQEGEAGSVASSEAGAEPDTKGRKALRLPA